jgi:hypothetical protein
MNYEQKYNLGGIIKNFEERMILLNLEIEKILGGSTSFCGSPVNTSVCGNNRLDAIFDSIDAYDEFYARCNFLTIPPLRLA